MCVVQKESHCLCYTKQAHTSIWVNLHFCFIIFCVSFDIQIGKIKTFLMDSQPGERS